jgi:uncharacterized protein
MKRRSFIQKAGLMGGGLLLGDPIRRNTDPAFPEVRTAVSSRKFKSAAIESAISEFKAGVKDPELGWLFNNCFPNTLDTTVTYSTRDGKPETYVITGDIDAMWLRDSSAQVWPYLSFMQKDSGLQQLISGVINRQTQCVLKDPYANAFYNDPKKIGEWSKDLTKMQPGLHERKWEIDSLCYPIRLAHGYWKKTQDITPFDQQWKSGIQLVLKTFREQQRKETPGPYSFQRKTSWATDGVPMNGFGYPVKPTGLICSAFRPSDDATIFLYLIPSNFFAVVSLRQAADMVKVISKDEILSSELLALAKEVEEALLKFAIIDHPEHGKVYAYEVNGFGSYNLMDDANVPSLMGLPYLSAISKEDPVYQNTRKLLLSPNNPFFYRGKAGEGIGGPHVGNNMIWPLGIIMRGLTSNDHDEIRLCISMLKKSNAGTGFMHESFNKDDVNIYTRKWFAWANTLFGEFLWETFQTNPDLLT